ncbi:pirin family protein [Legionella maceachernii]|uniref:Pirin-like protein n=1 Tax=Legionella maceachernii TaxID=466 RepID=A0A0W0VUZ9_9GAMM|nr:pirin family protein [Legionella maceachernii]KTD24064.1 pirin-like protein [Legionella maceachernii]SJZ85289.1 hypothetical protein SAMN02745128_01231 [Legionella maceachernii]SUO99242.1 Quercetin 2,3-dioxygenase [Legionella maceachernii]
MRTIHVEQQLIGTLIREGAGVKLMRYIGADRKNPFEPILLFDFFDSDNEMDYIAGFPSHPHRGFETITYLLTGQIAHQDNQGHQGVIGPGDVQWMTAGRGIIHSEMPQKNNEGITGLQLWLNLPAVDKWTKPRYQEYTASQLPVENHESGIRIKVIAGKTDQGIQSPIAGIATEPLFLDIRLPKQQIFEQRIAKNHQSMVFVVSGEIMIQGETVKSRHLAILSPGESLNLQGLAHDSHCLLITAKKLKEPIARLGPFVMNTEEEVRQAVEDFHNNRF